MATKISSVPMVFAAHTFALDCRAARRDLCLTADEVGTVINMLGATVENVEKARHEIVLISTFLLLCNAYELDPRKYWELKP